MSSNVQDPPVPLMELLVRVTGLLPLVNKNRKKAYFEQQLSDEIITKNLNRVKELVEIGLKIKVDGGSNGGRDKWSAQELHKVDLQIDKYEKEVSRFEAELALNDARTAMTTKILDDQRTNLATAHSRLTIALNAIPLDTVAGDPTIAAIKHAFDIFVIENHHVHDHSHPDHLRRFPSTYYAEVDKVTKTFCNAINAIEGLNGI